MQACKRDGIDRDGDASLGDGWGWVGMGMDSPGMGHPHLSLLIPKAIPFHPHAIPIISLFIPNSNEIFDSFKVVMGINLI